MLFQNQSCSSPRDSDRSPACCYSTFPCVWILWMVSCLASGTHGHSPGSGFTPGPVASQLSHLLTGLKRSTYLPVYLKVKATEKEKAAKISHLLGSLQIATTATLGQAPPRNSDLVYPVGAGHQVLGLSSAAYPDTLVGQLCNSDKIS